MTVKVATCPRCKGYAKPTKWDEFAYCPCGAVFLVQRKDGLTVGGPDGWRIVEVD